MLKKIDFAAGTFRKKLFHILYVMFLEIKYNEINSGLRLFEYY